MHKIISSIFCILFALSCAVFAQGEEPVADTTAAEKVSPAEEVSAPAETPVALTEEVAHSEEVAPAEVPAPQPETKTLSNEQVMRIMVGHNSYPKYLPAGLYVRTSIAPNNGVDLGVGYMQPLSKSWPVSLGFEPFHLQIAADDFQVVSDESLWIIAAGAVIGGLGPLFRGPESKTDSTKAPEKMGTAGTVLAAIALVPVYALCGTLYVPVVPGAWLGILDRSRLNTQLISEGFHKRSFTYMHDVGLRLSPFASDDRVLHGFIDGGVRFEKNFDADMKYNYFGQVGFSLSFY